MLAHPSVGLTAPMTDHVRDRKDCIARELGWPSYNDAPRPVQNNIDDRLIEIQEVHGILRPGN